MDLWPFGIAQQKAQKIQLNIYFIFNFVDSFPDIFDRVCFIASSCGVFCWVKSDAPLVHNGNTIKSISGK